jgi:hypothetical protein
MAETRPSVSSPSVEQVRAWAGHRLDEIAGGRVGRVEGVFSDEPSGVPEWLLARMGRFGHYTLVPARDAVEGAGHVWVPYTRDHIRRAPRIEPNAAPTAELAQRLREHYA